jgi:hypothetical protein
VTRWAARRTLWEVSKDRTCRGCGRTAMDPDTGVILARTAEGKAVALGLLKCGKLWLCPVCSAKIRNKRAEEISRAAVEWIGQGGTVVFVTFTARHAASHGLESLMGAMQGTRPGRRPCGKGACTPGRPCGKGDCDTLVSRKAGAYQRLISGAAWAGDKRRKLNPEGIRGLVGFIGMIRATEVTVSQSNGWHPHLHCLVFLGGRTQGERAEKRITGVFEPSTSAMQSLEGHFRAVWTRHLHAVDPAFTPSDEHGVTFETLDVTKSADAVAKYLAKLQEGKDASNELARGDMKTGRMGNMTPFEMLGRMGDLMGGVPDADAVGHGDLPWCRGRWAEYETASKGRRAIEWTRYLRQLLGLVGGDSEEDDMDLLFAQDGASEFRDGVAVSTEGWHAVAGRALDLAVTVEVESGRFDAVEALVVASGAPAAAVRVLTTGELTEAYDGVLAKLADRREAAAVRRKVDKA